MPNTREKLIELLDVIIQPGQKTLGDIADHFIANGVTFATDNNVGGKWIPVTERLPKSGKHVLVACVTPCGQYVCDAYYCSARSITGGCGDDLATIYDEDDDVYYLMPGWYEVIKNWDDYNSITIYDSVTHWMPLPEPPKGA